MKIIQFNSKTASSCVKETGEKTRKKITGFFVPLMLSLLLVLPSGCNFLDYNEIDNYEKGEVFTVSNRVKSLLANVYSYLPEYFLPVDGAMRASASDEALHVLSTSSVLKLNNGSWSATNTADDVWTSMYSGIRSANFFIDNATGLTFDEEKYGSSYGPDMIRYSYYTSEARFLRAFFYFELIKRYRDVPLITKVLSEEEANNVERTSFDNVVNFIVSECDAVSAQLPASFKTVPGAETGRANRYAALALKTRVLLYAASPLNNPSNNIQKWINAANAAKAIIDGGGYSLQAYNTIVNNLNSTELILEKRYADANSFERANFPIGYEGGNTGTCPTQNLVDAYEMKTTGLAISDPGSGYDPANPYANRDPRLSATIIYNGSTWKSSPVEIWVGGKNGPPKVNATKTGYYLRKNVVEAVNLEQGKPITTAKHNGVMFRYGEVLLNYAEAMNEAYGPDATGTGILTMTARTAVNLIRTRATMPVFTTGLSQAGFRTKLRNERRVELAFEDHRFWDIRRWKIGNTTTAIYGTDIAKGASNNITYTSKLVEQRIWDDRMYFYPIPQRELFINKKLTQNTGW
ncbi:MAG: RagB/SusD family nutrient uptake outer membrane protein [Prolixibacteraceae bacterium]|nr:RagB/SusD family nutrient uptake outer membrane protein [Prolixibacteraceae bacterium]